MAYKPIPTALFIRYLRKKGLESFGMKGSHEKWDYPGKKLLRPVMIRPAEDEIPPLHVKTNLDTLGITHDGFEKELVELGLVKGKGAKGKRKPK